MNAQLNYMIARQRCAERRRAGEEARLSRASAGSRCRLRDAHPTTRASNEPSRARPALEAETTVRGAR